MQNSAKGKWVLGGTNSARIEEKRIQNAPVRGCWAICVSSGRSGRGVGGNCRENGRVAGCTWATCREMVRRHRETNAHSDRAMRRWERHGNSGPIGLRCGRWMAFFRGLRLEYKTRQRCENGRGRGQEVAGSQCTGAGMRVCVSCVVGDGR